MEIPWERYSRDSRRRWEGTGRPGRVTVTLKGKNGKSRKEMLQINQGITLHPFH